MRIRNAILSTLACALFIPAVQAGEVADAINLIAEGEHRSQKYRDRNQYRHPGETLEFFGIRPDMTVVEISPGGGGWYTEILAPYLAEQGEYHAGSYDPESTSSYAERNSKRYAEKLASNEELYGKVNVGVFSAPNKLDTVAAGSADMVVTFRNMHSWMRPGNHKVALQGMYDMLKSGGVLGLVAHRGDEAMEQDPKAGKGYIKQSLVIEFAESVGFELEASSEINANPKDTHDHPGGVWSLPPSFDGGDTDREKYAAIGESDRMTLRFKKP